MAFVVSNQQYVSGVARVKLFKGHAMIVGRKSEHSLYRHELATYEEGDQYDSSAAQGFIKIHGLSQTTQAKHQMLKGPGGGRLELPSIIPPDAQVEGDLEHRVGGRTQPGVRGRTHFDSPGARARAPSSSRPCSCTTSRRRGASRPRGASPRSRTSRPGRRLPARLGAGAQESTMSGLCLAIMQAERPQKPAQSERYGAAWRGRFFPSATCS